MATGASHCYCYEADFVLLLYNLTPLFKFISGLSLYDYFDYLNLIFRKFWQSEWNSPVSRTLRCMPVNQYDLLFRLSLRPVRVRNSDRHLLNRAVSILVLVDVSSGAVSFTLDQPSIFFSRSAGPPAAAPAGLLSQPFAFSATKFAWPSPKALANAGRSAQRCIYLTILGERDRSACGKKIGT